MAATVFGRVGSSPCCTKCSRSLLTQVWLHLSPNTGCLTKVPCRSTSSFAARCGMWTLITTLTNWDVKQNSIYKLEQFLIVMKYDGLPNSRITEGDYLTSQESHETFTTPATRLVDWPLHKYLPVLAFSTPLS